MSENSSSSMAAGIGAGEVIGMIFSWLKWHSLLSLIWPLLFGWFYVLYFFIRYSLPK